jgi:hypothetical protein
VTAVFNFVVGARGFEPPTSRSRTVRATRLRYAPFVQDTQCRLHPVLSQTESLCGTVSLDDIYCIVDDIRALTELVF